MTVWSLEAFVEMTFPSKIKDVAPFEVITSGCRCSVVSGDLCGGCSGDVFTIGGWCCMS